MAVLLAALAGSAALTIQARPVPPTEIAAPAPPAADLRAGSYVLVPARSDAHHAPPAARVRRGVAGRNRAVVPSAPATDLWATVPDLAMSYRTGRRGPVIELGAFGQALRPLPDEQAPFDDASFAHLSLAWKF